ncbi:methyltransferase domain-containing protein [Lacipirellula sp.]|uniref:methyltransferase domain-containing protein n=1 Tax=Lacipirellula sp. TaxID=2691419 RepID=UPI003D0D3B4D
MAVLSQREFQPELMDQFDIPKAEHVRALQGLRRLNTASGVSRQLWRQIAMNRGVLLGGRLRVLDVACGGGDVAMSIWKLARRHSVTLDMVGLDRSPTACEQASQRCRVGGASMELVCTDAVQSPLPGGFDVVMSSLFLHHLSRPDAVALLAKMRDAGRLLVVSDLRRSAVGYLVAHAACRLVTRSPIVRYDGPQSVANAFSITEVADLWDEAGLSGAIVRRAWPWRLTITHHEDWSGSSLQLVR